MDQILRVVFPDTDSSRSKGCRKMDNEFTEEGGDLKVKMIWVWGWGLTLVQSFFSMVTIQKFEDLEIWQLARSFCQKIYPLTFVDPIAKVFRYKDQVRGAAVR